MAAINMVTLLFCCLISEIFFSHLNHCHGIRLWLKCVIRSLLLIMQHAHGSDSDSENRHKRHKKDRDSSRRNGGHELEDGELGEDGEVH